MKGKIHVLFFGDPAKGADYCINIPEAPTPMQQQNLKEMLGLYYYSQEIDITITPIDSKNDERDETI